MKRFAPLTLIATASLVLAGCAGDTDAPPEPAETTADTTTGQPASLGHQTAPPEDEAHYMTIFEDGEVAPDLSEEEHLYTGYRICEHLLHGEILPPTERDEIDAAGIEREVLPVEVDTVVETKQYLVERIGSRLDTTDRDVMIFAAAWSLCPTVQDQLTEEAKEVRPFSLHDGN